MTPFPWTDLLIIACLIVLNAVFAMSELAIVSAKTTRLQAKAERGSAAAATALELAGDPGKFLSTVQIGITLVGIISGAYSGASLGGPIGERLEGLLGMSPDLAAQAGFALVIALTTYATLVIGELVPKQLALRAAEPIALVMARPMKWLAIIAAPVVWVLDFSSATIVRLFGVRPGGQSSVTAEELQMLFAEATRSGVLEAEQSAILKGVVRLADRPVRELMTPRTEVDWVDASADRGEIEQTFAESPHSLMPVGEGSPDRIIGVVKVRDVLAAMVAGGPFALADMVKRVEVVPDQLDAMDALRVLQQADVAMAMVHDEYGHLDGIVTPIDLLTAIVGQFESDKDQGEIPEVIERADGSLLVSGSLSAEELRDRLDLDYGEDRDFATAAGFALWVLKHLPEEGEVFTHQGWRFEVVDMDGRKIDKLLVQRIDPEGDSADRDG
ncbi:hemolysin family protein [Alteriqipengyuania sp. 357]